MIKVRGIKVLTLFLNPKDLTLAMLSPEKRRAEKLKLPNELEDQMKALANINIIDLDELEKKKRKQLILERKRKKERITKLGNYRGKTRLGN